MSRGVPSRGDILALSLDRVVGHEVRGTRSVLVLSADAFNRASGLLLVAPISQGGHASRETGFSVTLMRRGHLDPGHRALRSDANDQRTGATFPANRARPTFVVNEALDAVRSILE